MRGRGNMRNSESLSKSDDMFPTLSHVVMFIEVPADMRNFIGGRRHDKIRTKPVKDCGLY